ncbi:UDP-N-acetylglucosamine 4,6-dehydratase (inverting) [Candidatus Pelagibacter ubique]|nr:UDP-N-acetylglucosamine 4,6-dehydratase (inverting) [Candidatus Pelagibacter ubique]
MFKNKIFFITGGTGSFGKAYTEFLLKKTNVQKIIIFSRDEQKQFALQNEPLYSKNEDRLRFFIGDIRDGDRLKTALDNDIDYVIHAAALKHVPLSEYNPFETIKTNIIGSENLIKGCIERNIPNVVALSTDKASSPVNLYGATKLAADKLFVAANAYSKKGRTKLSVVRYGNVMGSRGSIVPYLIKNKDNKQVNVTDRRMTRFNITLQQSVDFVTNSFKSMVGGEIFIPKIPSYNILDLVGAISPKSKINLIGIRPGEKLHEQMISESDSQNTIEFKNYYIILPNSNIHQENRKFYQKQIKLKKCKPVKLGFSYESNKNSKFLSIKEIKSLILDL